MDSGESPWGPVAGATFGHRQCPGRGAGGDTRLYHPGEVTVILSENSEAWGSFFYDPTLDAARVTTHLEDASHEEMLSYAFSDVTKTGAILSLRWEKKRIPIPITVDTDAVVVASLKRDLTSGQGFDDRVYIAAVGYLIRSPLEKCGAQGEKRSRVLPLAFSCPPRSISPAQSCCSPAPVGGRLALSASGTGKSIGDLPDHDLPRP